MQELSVGGVIEGKVTGVKPFGAFVAINDEKQGLVHISEVSHDYVKDINNVLQVGDTVKVKIMKVDEESGKISLSIRAAQPKPQNKPQQRRGGGGGGGSRNNQKPGFNTLEQKLKDWLKESNEKQAQLNKRLKK